MKHILLRISGQSLKGTDTYHHILLKSILALGLIALAGCGPQHNTHHQHTSNNAPSLSSSTNIINEETGDVVVLYTDKGFEPEVTNILKGQSITFINQSSLPLHVASDPHPSHTDYPGFDAGSHMNGGSSFTQVFDNSGTYGFHNHLKSLHKGIVRIVDNEKELIDIEKTLPHMRDTRNRLLELLTGSDSRAAIDNLFNTIESDPILVNDCHDMAHDLGHRSYDLYGFSRALTYDDPHQAPRNNVDDLCAGGYMHGVLEGHFLHNPHLKDNPEQVCAHVPTEHQGSCYHGVGHGIMFATERDLKAATAACRAIDAFEPEHRCYEGVYMELFRGAVFHGSGELGRNIEQPLSLCKDVPFDEQAACHLYAHLGYMRTHKHDYQGAMDMCMNSDLGDRGQQFCIKGVGITTMKSFRKAGLQHTELYTNGLNHQHKIYYYEGMLGYAQLSGINKDELQRICEIMQGDSKPCLEVLHTMKR